MDSNGHAFYQGTLINFMGEEMRFFIVICPHQGSFMCLRIGALQILRLPDDFLPQLGENIIVDDKWINKERMDFALYCSRSFTIKPWEPIEIILEFKSLESWEDEMTKYYDITCSRIQMQSKPHGT